MLLEESLLLTKVYLASCNFIGIHERIPVEGLLNERTIILHIFNYFNITFEPGDLTSNESIETLRLKLVNSCEESEKHN